MSTTISNRPVGATIAALILGWLAFGGFGNAFVWRTAGQSLQVPESSPLGRFVDAASSPLFTILALTYGVTALASCVGIWRMRPWMDKAFLVWGIVVTVMGTWMVWAIPAELLAGGRAVGIAFVILTAALLGLVYRYLQRIAPRPVGGQ